MTTAWLNLSAPSAMARRNLQLNLTRAQLSLSQNQELNRYKPVVAVLDVLGPKDDPCRPQTWETNWFTSEMDKSPRLMPV